MSDRAGFNLAEDGWVPVRGSGELSLREALQRAHELPGWPGGDPLAASAMMRLLTALAYRCAAITGSGTFKQAVGRERLFEPGAVGAYLDKHVDELWLLPAAGSGHRPFYQDPELTQPAAPGLRALEPKPVCRSGLSMDTAPSYVWGQQHPDPVFTPAAAARAMLVFLLWARAGGGARHPRLAERGTVFQAGRLRTKVSLHPVGETLEDTLRLHLVDPAVVGDDLPGGVGSPSWELPPVDVTVPLADARTILESLTGRWEKTVLLVADDGLVGRAVCASGRLRDQSRPPAEHDPYAVRWAAEPDDAEQDPPPSRYVYLRGSAERAAWRDLDSFRASAGGDGCETIVVRGVSAHPAAGRLRGWVTVSHQQGRQMAKDVVKSVSMIPAASVVDDGAGARAAELVADAELIGRRLRGALQGLYRDVGHPSAVGAGDAFTAGVDDRNPDAAVFARGHMPGYWDRMERLLAGTVPEGHDRSEVLDTARAVFDRAAGSFGRRMSARRQGPDGPEAEPAAVTAARWRACIRFPEPDDEAEDD